MIATNEIVKLTIEYHQKYFEKQGFGFLIEENQIQEKLFPLIKSIHKDKSLLNTIRDKQKLVNKVLELFSP